MMKNQLKNKSFDEACELVDFEPTIDDLEANERIEEEERVEQMVREKEMEKEDAEPEQTERDNWDM